MNTKLTFGERLADLRNEKKIKQKELGNMLGLKRNSISSYESNAYYPIGENIIKLADIFGVSTDYLLCRIDGKIDWEVLSSNFIDGEEKVTITKLLELLVSIQDESKRKLIYDTIKMAIESE